MVTLSGKSSGTNRIRPKDLTVRLNELVVAQLTEHRLQFAAPLHQDFSRIWEIRPSPDSGCGVCVRGGGVPLLECG